MKRLLIACLAGLWAPPALAHHPMDGAPMETFAHGLLSGVGHPVLGFDHLFFIAAVGIAAMFTGYRFTAPLGYLAGMTAGCVMAMAGIMLPLTELVIALSLVVAGGILMSGRAAPTFAVIGVFGVLGLFHGWAFGEVILGQEGGAPGTVIAGYMIGLVATQWIIAVTAGKAMEVLWGVAHSEAIEARLAGGIVAGVGAFLVLETAEAAAFAVLRLS